MYNYRVVATLKEGRQIDEFRKSDMIHQEYFAKTLKALEERYEVVYFDVYQLCFESPYYREHSGLNKSEELTRLWVAARKGDQEGKESED